MMKLRYMIIYNTDFTLSTTTHMFFEIKTFSFDVKKLFCLASAATSKIPLLALNTKSKAEQRKCLL